MLYYLKSDYTQSWSATNGHGTGPGNMEPATKYMTKADGGSFLSHGDTVYVWKTLPDAAALEGDPPAGAEVWTYGGQVRLEDGSWAPWIEKEHSSMGYSSRFVDVLLPEGRPVSNVDVTWYKHIFGDRGWDDYNENGWDLTSTLDENADVDGGGGLPGVDFEPGAHGPEAEPGDVRYVEPPADSSPLRAIQGTTAYGREDADPETIETITYAFAPAGADLPFDLVSDDWTDRQKEAYRAAHAVYEDVANVRFVEVDPSEDPELLEYVENGAESAAPTLGGLQEFPAASTSLGFLNTYYFDMDDGRVGEPGGFFFGTILHEQGHGLGLGHPHDEGNGTTVMRGVDGPKSLGDDDLNQGVYTVMSYNQGYPERFGESYGAFGEMIGLGAFDIAAIQNMYGANTTTRTGDDVYRLDDENGPGAGFKAIWDAGGTDTLRYDGDRFSHIDLRAATLEYEEGGGGFVSFVDKVKAGRTIANDVVIENAVGGSARDYLSGNDADNILRGRGGSDTFEARGGADVVRGGTGNDTAVGGDGDDRIAGKDGDDVLSGDAGDARRRGDQGADGLQGGPGDDRAAGGGGMDTVLGNEGADLLSGGRGRDLLEGMEGPDAVRGGADRDYLTGDDGADLLRGGAGADVVEGGRGDDSAHGGRGNDTVSGGPGDDTLFGGAGADRFVFVGGDDVIADFDPEADRLVLGLDGVTGFSDILVEAVEGGARISADGDVLTLDGIDPAELTTDNVDFILVV